MTITQIEIQLIAVFVAIACALPGVFLVLRGMAMLSDAITHTVLLGIVLTFFAIKTLDSPLLMIGATIMGILTVSLVETLNNTRLVKQDAAIGLVFPALFSLAVILISKYTGGIHLDTDAVLLGELAFAPFNRFNLLGLDLPHALVAIGGILLIQAILFSLFYKELKISTFDPGLAAALGFAPTLIHYGLMTIVSITAVGAFDAVGSVLVVAFMIAPAAAAYLLTDHLNTMIKLSILIGIASALGGYWLARLLDANIAGAMATMTGFLFLLVFIFAPNKGILSIVINRRRQRWDFAATALTIHLLHHENQPAAATENRIDHLREHFNWDDKFALSVVKNAAVQGLIHQVENNLSLTTSGRETALQAMNI